MSASNHLYPYKHNEILKMASNMAAYEKIKHYKTFNWFSTFLDS